MNERHIYSTICHLDMITTLRGLDEILSLPQKPQQYARVSSKSTSRPQCKRIVYESPYLEPQRRPIIPISKPLPRIPLPDPCFSPYDKYRDLSYIVENEETRFYGTNKELAGCGCSVVNRDLILQQFCPTDHTAEEHEEYAERLFENFVEATYCYCMGNHSLENDISSNSTVYYVQLEQAKTNSEFIAILKTYIGQLVVVHIMKQLLFGDNEDITNISACVNCRKCERDYERLKKLTEKQNRMQKSFKPYEARILFSIFGNDGPAGLLTIFNEIAKKRDQTVDACVRGVWKSLVPIWSDSQTSYDESDGEMSCDLEATDVNPRNSKLMDCMLSKALRTLQADSKFVIPHLPQANEIPLLKQWIRVRYGIKYSRPERAKMLRTSLRQWLFLERVGHQRTPVPMAKDVCQEPLNLHEGHRHIVNHCVRVLC